jgi:predicted Zn finger-like uncharacterized protein
VKLSCPACSAKYSIADEKVQDRLAKIRCRKCSATIIVDGKVNPPSVYTSEGGSSPAAETSEATDSPAGSAQAGDYSVDFGDSDQRSMSVADIVQAFRRGELTADTYVWAESMSDWQPIGAVPELAEALNAAAPPSPSAPPRAAARTGAGRGSAHDLFGGIDKAGSEEDVMTSAPQGGGGGAAAAAGAVTGARNESSVLFSLSALTASGPIAPGPSKSAVSMPASSDSKVDDSGLIDLRALTSSVGSQPVAGPLGLGSPSLGMAAPLGGMTAPVAAMDGPPPQAASSKTGLYIGGALVLVGALIAGAIVLKPQPPAPVAVAAPVAPAPVAPPPEPKKEEPTAQPPATGTAATEAAPKVASAAKPAAGGGGHASKPKASSGSLPAVDKQEKPSSSPPPSSASDSSSGDGEPKKKKKEKSCNCSPGDLMCAMKCASS